MKIAATFVTLCAIIFSMLKIFYWIDFNKCIQETILRHNKEWSSFCEKDDCGLPVIIANQLLDEMRERQEQCARIYK